MDAKLIKLKEAKEKNNNELERLSSLMAELDKAKKKCLQKVYELICENKRITDYESSYQNSEIKR